MAKKKTKKTSKNTSYNQAFLGAALQELGQGAGQLLHDATIGAITALPGLIPDNNNFAYRRPPNPQDVSPYPNGNTMGGLYNDGGIVTPLHTGQLKVEDNQYSFLSPDMIMLNGEPHSKGGTMLQYGGNMVEAEQGEPVSIGQDGQAIVYGNMEVPGTNKKFKTVAKQIGKEEAKNAKMLGKATNLIDNSNPYNAYEALSFNTGNILNKAAQMKDQQLSMQKDALSNLQQAMLDYADAHGMKPEKLSKNMKKGGKLNPLYEDGGCLECGGEMEAKSGFKLNPKHKGWCTPMTKSTCTGKRRQFAINAKNHFKKQEDGGELAQSGKSVKFEKLYDMDHKNQIGWSPVFEGFNQHEIDNYWSNIPESFGGLPVARGQNWQELNSPFRKDQFIPSLQPANTQMLGALPQIPNQQLSVPNPVPQALAKAPQPMSNVNPLPMVDQNFPVNSPGGFQTGPIKKRKLFGNLFKNLMENGGELQVGQELELTPEEYQFLKSQGFKFH